MSEFEYPMPRTVKPLKLPPIEADLEKPRRRRPETADERTARLKKLSAVLAEREQRARSGLAEMRGALPRSRGHVKPLSAIRDLERRIEVQKARVEQLESLLSQLTRKQHTRAKIIAGAALLVEAKTAEDKALMDRFLEILDRRVERPKDRLALAEAFGLPLEPVKPGSGEGAPELPNFDAMLPPELRESAGSPQR